jgi:hypothetical protein
LGSFCQNDWRCVAHNAFSKSLLVAFSKISHCEEHIETGRRNPAKVEMTFDEDTRLIHGFELTAAFEGLRTAGVACRT